MLTVGDQTAPGERPFQSIVAIYAQENNAEWHIGFEALDRDCLWKKSRSSVIRFEVKYTLALYINYFKC